MRPVVSMLSVAMWEVACAVNVDTGRPMVLLQAADGSVGYAFDPAGAAELAQMLLLAVAGAELDEL